MTTADDEDVEPSVGAAAGGDAAGEEDGDPAAAPSFATPPTDLVVGPASKECVFDPTDVATAGRSREQGGERGPFDRRAADQAA